MAGQDGIDNERQIDRERMDTHRASVHMDSVIMIVFTWCLVSVIQMFTWIDSACKGYSKMCTHG